MKKQILLSALAMLLLLMAQHYAFAQQNVGIGTATPDASAMLDITATDKGILIPRLTTTQRTGVASPATGLLVYDTDTKSFWYFNGTSWINLSGAGSTGWLLTGNSGTNPSVNFMGTTDDQPLIFRVNNKTSGKIDRTLRNTFWGYQAGSSNATGSNNTANGYFAFFSNTVGSYNNAIGHTALLRSTEGFYNTANGYGALYGNIRGSYNTAIGSHALYSNTIGYFNTATGKGALYNNTTGGNNTAIGLNAMFSNRDGNGNTAVGAGSNVLDSNFTNATAIGYLAIVNASNTMQIGNSAVSNVYFGDGTSTVLHGASVTPSDARFKYNIQENVPGLDFITRLQPVTYFLDLGKLADFTKTGVLNDNNVYPVAYTGEKQLHTGFLAQDVEKIAVELGYQFDGIHKPANEKGHYSLAYSQFVVPLVKAVQEQQAIIDQQNNKIEMLVAQMKEMNKKIEALTQQNKITSANKKTYRVSKTL